MGDDREVLKMIQTNCVCVYISKGIKVKQSKAKQSKAKTNTRHKCEIASLTGEAKRWTDSAEGPPPTFTSTIFVCAFFFFVGCISFSSPDSLWSSLSVALHSFLLSMRAQLYIRYSYSLQTCVVIRVYGFYVGLLSGQPILWYIREYFMYKTFDEVRKKNTTHCRLRQRPFKFYRRFSVFWISYTHCHSTAIIR